ncbi:autotransporter outer membrane beta-barrel domain-containing protein [Roseococcus sp. SDR]|uniref:autotransporter outer membrane beta-barrel domain-containing protein n=1 Tax=Roseococcus sp. SDR TaxID=2835532 RepID=UPI001BCBD7A9|nr:autotransporter outer membrane beta-barrel domain-containing protein [Roseococcus sp. SDR]MBS7791795.1 autotransporter outer membrane beta-barrel domain-containing protein [Roseococcus sp. SDR]MBV1847109.1 autotransporter outer membrane beta-barrel domain-containing protein [Roseococcus sp. SDR]
MRYGLATMAMVTGALAGPAAAQSLVRAENLFRLSFGGTTLSGAFCIDARNQAPYAQLDAELRRLVPAPTDQGVVVALGSFAAAGSPGSQVRFQVAPTAPNTAESFVMTYTQGTPYIYSNEVIANSQRAGVCGTMPPVLVRPPQPIVITPGQGGSGGGFGGGSSGGSSGGTGGGTGGGSSGGTGGGTGGGSGGGTGGGGDQVVVTVLPGEVSGLQRNVARFAGDSLLFGGTQISDQIAFDFTRFAPMAGEDAARRWNIWGSPRYVGGRNTSAGVSVSGDYFELTGGLDFCITDNVILGLAVSGDRQESQSRAYGLNMNRDGWSLGPYLGWRIRPTTVFDIWSGYAGSKQKLNVPGESGSYGTERWFLAANLTEIVTTPWAEFRPRLTYLRTNDWAGAFTSTAGTRYLSDSYQQSSLSASVGVSQPFRLENGMVLRPFLRAGATYLLDQAVNAAPAANGTVQDLTRWSGQVRGGAALQISRNVEVSAQLGYLSLFVPNVNAWEGRALISFAF